MSSKKIKCEYLGSIDKRIVDRFVELIKENSITFRIFNYDARTINYNTYHSKAWNG